MGASLRPVVLHPAEVLREVCTPVTTFDGALGRLAVDMLRTMYAAQGRGLAAPQVGETLRLFVMDTAWKEEAPAPQVFVNPRVIAASTETATREEGCLSIPDQPVRVTRPAWVDLTWQDLAGTEHTARFDGFASACVQHEIDHLDGILILDKAAA
ncbi:peptide deformylase [Pseudaestuariivita sp.]|uniref:peptide deformylase n=1 Tax=Pseudaestuariivita sp. TaxID=2211669 RepID=UPI004057EE88